MLHHLQCELEEINTRFMQYIDKAKRLFGHQDYPSLTSVIEALKEDMHSLKLSYEKQLHKLICSVKKLENTIEELEREIYNKTEENARLADRISLESSKNAKLLLEVSELKTVLQQKDQQLLSFNSSLPTEFCERNSISNHDIKLYTSVDRTRRKRRSAEFPRHSISHKSTYAETILGLLGSLVEKFITSEESCTDIISVQNEIRKLQCLLKDEEHRLSSINNFHQVMVNENQSTPSRHSKRKQNFIARDFHRTSGALQISEINPQGRFVKIHNADNKGYNLSACKLMQTVDGDLLNEYEFDQLICLPAKASIALWTNDINNELSQQNHSASIRCQNIPCWGSGPNCTTSLYSPSGRLLAQLRGFSETTDDCVVLSSKMNSEECSCTTIGLPTTIPKKSGDSQTGSREIPDVFHKIKKNSITQHVQKFKPAYSSTHQTRN